ncbi:four helix bundle protein [Aequorivita sp. F47161]|uniref:Four helix bundle protein n=1 Tax=Aequorivita vitellina TaxID=2874475 RepID=A0A9X1QZR1_9FLAO|nr:four helix bundle protein [Aequorivita vitellina]
MWKVSLSDVKVGANYRAVCLGQSKKSFIAKLSIVVEEADESNFWIEFLMDEDLLPKDNCEPLLKESAELTSIFIASKITAEKKLNR